MKLQTNSMTDFKAILRVLMVGIVFTLLTVGCQTSKPSHISWLMPEPPEKYPVEFVKLDDGLFLDKEN